MTSRIEYTVDAIIIGAAWVIPSSIMDLDFSSITTLAVKSMQFVTTFIILITAIVRYKKSKNSDKKQD